MSDLPTIIVGMATITLSNGLAATVDESDYRGLAAHKWHAVRKRVAGVYAYRQHYGSGGGVRKIRTIYMHREVLGVTDRHVEVDHINGCTLDNRRANLRSCTHGENEHNYRRRKTAGLSSRYKGVHWSTARGYWCAHIKVSGKQLYLGRFADERTAAAAYNAAALRLHGAFACLNELA